MSVLSLCTDTCDVKRKSNSKDAAGGMTMTFSAVSGLTDLPCDVQPSSSSIRMQYMERQMTCTHEVRFLQDYAIKAGDLLVTAAQKLHVLGKVTPNKREEWPLIVDVEEQL